MEQKFDLLGHPIPEGRGKPGRTGHVPTPENASKIRVMLVAGMRPSQIAKQLGLSVPTLKKHYFQNGKVNARLAREMAIAEAKAKNMLQLQAKADDGSVPAMGKLQVLIEKAELDLIEATVGKAGKGSEQPIGRKQQRELQGHMADDDLEAELTREATGHVH